MGGQDSENHIPRQDQVSLGITLSPGPPIQAICPSSPKKSVIIPLHFQLLSIMLECQHLTKACFSVQTIGTGARDRAGPQKFSRKPASGASG